MLRFVITVLVLAPLARADDSFPLVADGIEVTLYAKDPLVRNPCAITFDAKGRLCVGMGPQYRNPRPDTPGDSVWILIDGDHDGIADSRHEFATGFNSIQGLAWNGDQLWVANAPDLTVVRDTDGDEVADEYLRLYTDLGNLEHGLHGLNVGPDGKVYMSKGNSKGLTRPPDRVAPKPFRDLWGVGTPGAPDFPDPVRSGRDDYEKNYHDPADDWGLTGGVLRCDADGSNLEIVARGFRNPWDIAFDDGFNWLGTDNDQTQGDKIFAPFFGAHFGWGHPWSYDWKGDEHLPTAPSSGPLFDGSGTGVVYLEGDAFPDKYSGIWLVNDWLRRETYVFRPEWEGAHLVPKDGDYRREIFAHAGGGRSMGQSRGRAYDPTDIEVGPDGAVYVASWGRVYGVRYEEGEMANQGRIYRIRPKGPDLLAWKWPDKPITEWTVYDLQVDLAGHLPARRVAAQRELLRRDSKQLRVLLRDELDDIKPRPRYKTWVTWTYGRLDPQDRSIDDTLVEIATGRVDWQALTTNLRIQALRILSHRARLRREPSLPDGLEGLLEDPEARVRHAAVLAAHEAGERRWNGNLIELCATERDRIVYYSAWRALQELMPQDKRKLVLEAEKRPAVRRALVLSLLEEDALDGEHLQSLARDTDAATAALATRRLGGKAETEIRGQPLQPGAVDDPPAAIARLPMVNPVMGITASTAAPYRVAALEPGVPAYTDRPYRIREVPDALQGDAFIQTANNDADAEEGITVKVQLRYPSIVYLADDTRAEALPAWARDGWQRTGWTIATDDPKQMRLYKREVPAGELVLGTNRDGVRARKGNYLLIIHPKLIDPPPEPTDPADVHPLLDEADTDRGRDLFFARWGSTCTNCHRLEGVGNEHAPDLAGIGARADAEFIIESILRPDAAITEGFSRVSLQLKSGKRIGGVIIEETGKEVTLAFSSGAKVSVERSEIVERVKSRVSAMPGGYNNILRPQQVADLTAYLLTRKQGAPEQAAAPPAAAVPAGELSFKPVGNGALELHLGSTRLATYLTAHEHLTRRAFVNVNSPSGIPVTRTFPAPEGSDHLHMHPGIWLAYGWIDGNDYWRFGSRVEFEKFLTEPRIEDGAASFATRNRYRNEADTETVCIEDASYRFSLVPGGVLLEIDASYYHPERDFHFGDQEESGLAVRIAEGLSVQFGKGGIVNDSGGRDGRGTWGKPFEWIDYSGTVGDQRIGFIIVPHPGNPRPSWSHSRDYGVLVANPFPKQPRERRDPYVKTPVKHGERFRLRYRLLIHEGPAGDFDAAAVARAARY